MFSICFVVAQQKERDLQSQVDRVKKELDQKTAEFQKKEADMQQQHQYALYVLCLTTHTCVISVVVRLMLRFDRYMG